LEGLAVLRQHLVGLLADELHQLVLVGAPHRVGRPALPLGATRVAIRVGGAPPVYVRTAVAPGATVVLRNCGANHLLHIVTEHPVLLATSRFMPSATTPAVPYTHA